MNSLHNVVENAFFRVINALLDWGKEHLGVVYYGVMVLLVILYRCIEVLFSYIDTL